MTRSYADLTPDEKGQLALTSAMADYLAESETLFVEELCTPASASEEDMALSLVWATGFASPLVTGFTVCGGPANPDVCYEVTIRAR